VVLVVDDDEAMLDSCPCVLARDGFSVVACSDGESGLKAMREANPDALIVDLKMPGMSGEEFLRHAKEIDPDAVVVVVTGYPELASAVEVMKAGAYDFLPKPFGAEELRIITRRAVERRRLALAAAAGEREKQHMRDNFVAMVSHQLKSPAACVRECLDAARSSFSDEMPDRCRELIDRAAARAQLLLDLMDDWLTLARVESGALKATRENVDLVVLVREALAAARECPDQNEVEVEVESRAPEACVRGDAEALKELFVNLLDNAMRYTPDGGRVAVCVAAAADGAVVSVSDTGPGIAPGDVELIFEPFYRGESAKRKHGTGLGLSIVKQIAEAHGGRVSVRSELGHGTTFEVRLPCAESAR
jgi:signal transduction histidine kinase